MNTRKIHNLPEPSEPRQTATKKHAIFSHLGDEYL